MPLRQERNRCCQCQYDSWAHCFCLLLRVIWIDAMGIRTPHNITTCEREDEGTAPDSVYQQISHRYFRKLSMSIHPAIHPRIVQCNISGRNRYIRLIFAFRGEDPCCRTSKHNNNEANDDTPTIQSILLAMIMISQFQNVIARVDNEPYPFAMLNL